MRVISGTARGISLISPTGLATRPTGDRMKEDLFNILAPLVSGADFLDLYCGSGAIGIEALSRGAKSAVFVDESKEAIATTKSNLTKARLDDAAEVLHMPVLRALEMLRSQKKFDIIFLDPPYGSDELKESLTFIDQYGLLVKGGIVVAEAGVDAQMPELNSLSMYRQKKYAQMKFSFYEVDDQ